MNLFDKVKCKGFYKRIYDGIYMYLDQTTLTAYGINTNLANGDNDGTFASDVDSIEKTYYEHKDANFTGVIVGYKDIVVTGYLDAEYQDFIDVGVGIIPPKYYVDKRPKDIVKCAIVYYANNKKHYVPLDDIIEIL